MKLFCLPLRSPNGGDKGCIIRKYRTRQLFACHVCGQSHPKSFSFPNRAVAAARVPGTCPLPIKQQPRLSPAPAPPNFFFSSPSGAVFFSRLDGNYSADFPRLFRVIVGVCSVRWDVFWCHFFAAFRVISRPSAAQALTLVFLVPPCPHPPQTTATIQVTARSLPRACAGCS